MDRGGGRGRVGTVRSAGADPTGLIAARVRWLIDPPGGPIRAEVKIRYQHRAAPATVELMGTDGVCVRFETPQTAVTPGQAAVFYDGDIVLGGGWIEGAGGVE